MIGCSIRLYCLENYHKLFDNAVERYNARQKRKDRRVDDYYEKIRIGRQEKLFHDSAERRWQVVNNPLDTFILKYLFSTSLRPFHVFIHTL